jgi:hypothetical protein
VTRLLTTQLEEGSVIIQRSGGRRPRPVARPLPPPAADMDELAEVLERRSGRRGPQVRQQQQQQQQRQQNQQGAGTGAEGEPELPPTPSQLGLEEPGGSTPPSGIRSSSPSRRKLKRRMLQGGKRSSPLKKPPMRPEDVGAALPAKKKTDPLANPQDTVGRAVVVLHPQRRVEAEDVHVEKLRLLGELRREEEALAEDLKNISAWNKELWDRVAGGRDELAEEFLDDGKVGWVHGRLLEGHEKSGPAPDPSADLMEAAQNPAMWLPFGDMAALQGTSHVGEEAEDLSGIVSHHPIKMTADEERPYLQAFSPLTFTSTPPMRVEREGARQECYFRDITVRATAMPTLFAASIVLIVDETEHTVEELRVPRLDRNAEAELRPFIDEITAVGSPSRRANRATERNASILGWAMGEWYRTAVKRARFWHALERMVAAEDQSRATSVRLRGGEKPVAEKELLPYMGCLSRVVSPPQWGEEAAVRVEWRILFDWTGEAKSKVGLTISGPAECKWFILSFAVLLPQILANDPAIGHQADERGGLGAASKVFDELVRGTGDVADAARRVFGLLDLDSG